MIGAIVLVVRADVVASRGGNAPWPGASTIVRDVIDRWTSVYQGAVASSMTRAAVGLVVGGLVGLALVAAARLSRQLARPAQVVAISSFVVPIIALGPILVVFLEPDNVSLALASVGAVFPLFANLSSVVSTGLRSERAVFAVLGSTIRARVLHLDLPRSVLPLLNGLRLAVPGSLLGASVGEWFGATSGLGVLIATGLREVNRPQTWAAAGLIASAGAVADLVLLAVVTRLSGRLR